jgi:hypothetical protein
MGLRLLLCILSISWSVHAYVDGDLLMGDVGATQVTINNLGPLGASQTLILGIGASQRFLFWASKAGYPEHGGVTSLSTTNTGVSGCTAITATWSASGKALGVITSGTVSGWTIVNPGNDFIAAPTVTTTNSGCSQTPAATATIATSTACPAPCSQSMNTEYGRNTYFYEVLDSSGNRLNPRVISSALKMSQTIAPCEVAPFTVFKSVHGLTDYQTCSSFSVAGGTNVSGLRVWLKTFNLRNGKAAVWTNAGTPILLNTTKVTGMTCATNVCTATTLTPHGLAANQKVQLNGFRQIMNASPSPPTSLWLNNMWTVTTVPDRNTFTILATENSITPSNVSYLDLTKRDTAGSATVSATAYMNDETRWFGGIRGTRQAVEVVVPIPDGNIIAGATNTITFQRVDGLNNTGHGWWTDWEIIQPNVEISQIVVAGANAVATTTTTHGYSIGDTLLIQSAPGPQWRFNGRVVITAVTSNTFTFLWGANIVNGTAGVSPYLTANGTYTVPRTRSSDVNPQPHMYAARCLIPASSFARMDPATQPTFGGNATNGATVFSGGLLKETDAYFANHASIAHCASCHIKSGYDLKYFGWPERTSIVAGMQRGLSESDAKDVAVFVRSNAVATPIQGRPWNPAYQPGCAIDSDLVINWAAGCGQEWVLTYDEDLKEYLTPGGSFASWAYNVGVNQHNLPLPVQMHSWMKWLPETAPQDFASQVLGIDFSQQPLWTDYTSYSGSMTVSDFTSYQAAGTFLNNLANDYQTFSVQYSSTAPASGWYPARYSGQLYSVGKWLGTRMWELVNTNQNENLYDQVVTSAVAPSNARVPAMATRGIYQYRMVFDRGPHVSYTCCTFNYLQEDETSDTTNWTFETAVWYLLSAIIDPGNGMAAGNQDWGYYALFNDGISSLIGRSYMYVHLMQAAIIPRQSLGYALPATGCPSGGMCASLHLFNGNYPLYFTYNDYLTSDADLASIAEGLAVNDAQILALFTTAQWQAWVSNQPGGSLTLSAVPSFCSTKTIPSGGGMVQSCLAYDLALMNTLGVDSTTLGALAAWGNAVFPALSNRFTTDAAATCTVGGIPRTWTCSNF